MNNICKKFRRNRLMRLYRRRCPHCGYSGGGWPDSGECPSCGETS